MAEEEAAEGAPVRGRRRAPVAGDEPVAPGRRRRGGELAARGILGVLATIVDIIVAIVAILIVLGILFVVLNANQKNTIVSDIHDAAKWLVGPFDGLFTPKNHRLGLAINWGIAAAVYVVIGRIIASLLRRGA